MYQAPNVETSDCKVEKGFTASGNTPFDGTTPQGNQDLTDGQSFGDGAFI